MGGLGGGKGNSNEEVSLKKRTSTQKNIAEKEENKPEG